MIASNGLKNEWNLSCEAVMEDPEYIEIQYPSVRQFTADMGIIDREKHYVRALLEVDVTDALQKIRIIRTPEKKVSFLAWFIKVLADTVAVHPPISGVHRGRNSVVAFKDIDISTIVEKIVDGVPVPLPLVLRDANNKTYFQLTDEIQSAVSQSVNNAGNLVLGKGENSFLLELAAALPQRLRVLSMRWFILNNPQRLQKMMGTVMVTSLGTMGRISGWIIPTSMHPLSIGIGSLSKKPAIHEGNIEKRDILHLTVAIDHDVIDGMPAFQFVDDLVTRLEKGSGLETA
jgi:pyruvate/2-oxoglutarate dehydrogenase complex dihydrolipoamide acyltransferase (E2) component